VQIGFRHFPDLARNRFTTVPSTLTYALRDRTHQSKVRGSEEKHCTYKQGRVSPKDEQYVPAEDDYKHLPERNHW